MSFFFASLLMRESRGPTVAEAQVLLEAEESPASVDEIVLVGGSTRIPKVPR